MVDKAIGNNRKHSSQESEGGEETCDKHIISQANDQLKRRHSEHKSYRKPEKWAHETCWLGVCSGLCIKTYITTPGVILFYKKCIHRFYKVSVPITTRNDTSIWAGRICLWQQPVAVKTGFH